MKEPNYTVDIVAMFPKQGPIVTIDGTAAGGKSTVARRMARNMGFNFYDTGTDYRLLALLASDAAGSGAELEVLAEAAVDAAQNAVVECHDSSDAQHLQIVIANGRDVTDLLRMRAISELASQLAKLMPVRHALKIRERRLCAVGKMIVVGRDCGTVLFPDADIKFLFKVTIEAQAQRRWREELAAGREVQLVDIQRELEARDRADSTRSIAPLKLKAPSDTIAVPTHFFDFETVLKLVEYQTRERLNMLEK